jgi:hypothetical protein
MREMALEQREHAANGTLADVREEGETVQPKQAHELSHGHGAAVARVPKISHPSRQLTRLLRELRVRTT